MGEGTEEGGESETKDTLSVNSSLLDISELDEKVSGNTAPINQGYYPHCYFMLSRQCYLSS